mmetsp:Transcript_33749/g.81596  ORF Transcript_33749/g.81596 Transcript_33749/m.81596 type:complete len:196 (+) Transcript_33749:127-714(+)
MNRFTCTIALLATASTNALVTNNRSPATKSFASDRRNFFGVLGGAAAAAVASAATPQPANAAGAIKTGPANPFTGDYDDPNHPNCLRQVKVVGAPQKADGSKPLYAIVEVTGYDGKDGVCKDRPSRADLWQIKGKTKGKDEAFLDFSPKGGPSDLVGKWDGSGIVFPDGNKWTKLNYAPRNRRPEDMSTLSDGPL